MATLPKINYHVQDINELGEQRLAIAYFRNYRCGNRIINWIIGYCETIPYVRKVVGAFDV